MSETKIGRPKKESTILKEKIMDLKKEINEMRESHEEMKKRLLLMAETGCTIEDLVAFIEKQ